MLASIARTLVTHRSRLDKLAPVIAWLLADAASEGKNVIIGMLITGLIFVAVIAIGETTHALRHRRRSRH